MKKLEGLQWKPMWTSHMGCLAGCKDYMNLDLSDAAIFGGTGHAFILNLAQDLCPSGPTAWMTGMLFNLGSNVGLKSEFVFGQKNNSTDFPVIQKKAYEFICQKIDAGIPCYGWEMDMAEYQVVS